MIQKTYTDCETTPHFKHDSNRNYTGSEDQYRIPICMVVHI
jgi:hypothetical protein